MEAALGPKVNPPVSKCMAKKIIKLPGASSKYLEIREAGMNLFHVRIFETFESNFVQIFLF